MWSKIRRVATPGLPVSLAEVKQRLRIDGSSDDADLYDFIRGAADLIEGPDGAGIALNSQQYDIYYDSFPAEFLIPVHPIISVDSITYELSGEQTVDSADYESDLIGGRVRPLLGNSWPSTDTVFNAVKLRFTSGYTALPGALKDAITLMVGHRYEHREDASEMSMETIPNGAMSIIEQYRRGRFG